MKKWLVGIVVVLLCVAGGLFVIMQPLLAAPSLDASAFVAIVGHSKDYSVNTIILNLQITFAGPAVPTDEGLSEAIVEIIPGDTLQQIAAKITAATQAKATELGHPVGASNIVMPSLQKGQQ